MPNPYLSIIIPAYNEEKRIEKTLLAAHEYLSKQNYPYEIIVVLDGSTDNTLKVVEKNSKSIRHLTVIHNNENRGKGSVVAQGMLAAKGEFRLFTDADNSTSIEQVEKLLPFFKQGYEVVIGSRQIEGAVIAEHQSFIRELAGRIGNFIIRTAAVPNIKDTQCGFKMFSARAAQDVFNRLTILRWGFDIEALAIARFLGYKIKEVPIVWKDDNRGHVKGSAYLQVLTDIFKIRYNMAKNKYR